MEKDFWGEPTYDSHLVKTCHRLRQKLLQEFDTEDLRIMIGQNIGLKYLIPMALETLKDNVLAEGDLYEGDLLKSVLTSDKDFWENEKDNFEDLEKLIRENEDLIREMDPRLLKNFDNLKKK
ncbi:contact-dependent growth inhibition system immunity protein [Algoriphagus litoralis]|uniref:contact-dependent growth inhibition system immunity protein n=1 Tax=Algoriphagus litoralis TaxID=2202829 RepID=UPI0018E50BCB|nr:contact-dependent growth inhibition system immunity protein [Algoriphagus litoralis]